MAAKEECERKEASSLRKLARSLHFFLYTYFFFIHLTTKAVTLRLMVFVTAKMMSSIFKVHHTIVAILADCLCLSRL